MAVLFLHGVGELVGELLTKFVCSRMTKLLSYLSWSVVALLCGYFLAGDTFLSILGLKLFAIMVNGEDTSLVFSTLSSSQQY